MAGISEAGRSRGIEQLQLKTAARTEPQPVKTEVITETSLNPNDQNQVKKPAQGSSPGKIDFTVQKPDKGPNALLTLLALLVAIAGGLTPKDGTYNPELMDAVCKNLEKCSELIGKHGNSLGMDIFGNYEVPPSRKGTIDKQAEDQQENQTQKS